MRRACAVLPLLLLAASAGAAQEDFRGARSAFLEAVLKAVSSDSPASQTEVVAAGARGLVAIDSRQAVDALLDGYGVCVKRIAELWVEKRKWMEECERNSDYKMTVKKDPSQGHDLPSSETGKYFRHQEAMGEVQRIEALLMGIDAVKRAVVESLGGFRSEEAVKELQKRLKMGADWTQRAGVAEALGRISAAGALDILLEQLFREREPGVRVAILEAFKATTFRDSRVIAAAMECLRDDFWQVQFTALEYLRGLGADARHMAGDLIELLRDAEGRLKKEINDTLVVVTGVDKHGDYEAWRHWWQENEETVKRSEYKPGPNNAAGPHRGTQSSFYGIPVESQRVIFILDRSLSMIEPSNWDIGPGEEVATGKNAKQVPDHIKKEGDRKIDIARWQLKRCLAMLDDGVFFNIIFYNQHVGDDTILDPEKMVKLEDATRRQAYEFIDRLDPIGQTNIFDPLERAFGFSSSGERLVRGGVDTIFLLTDGLPNSGAVPTPGGIVERVRDLNKTHKIRINTIGVFSSEGMTSEEVRQGHEFMKQLAEESGGIFRAPPPKESQ